MNRHTTTVKLSDLPVFVNELLITLVPSTTAVVLALSGDLGAGKTTFVKNLAAALGLDSADVTSPTFTIMKGYETPDAEWEELIHMDAYRIEDIEELGPLRFREMLNQPNTLFCIEWAEKIESALPANTIWLHFTNTSEEEVRTIEINKLD